MPSAVGDDFARKIQPGDPSAVYILYIDVSSLIAFSLMRYATDDCDTTPQSTSQQVEDIVCRLPYTA